MGSKPGNHDQISAMEDQSCFRDESFPHEVSLSRGSHLLTTYLAVAVWIGA